MIKLNEATAAVLPPTKAAELAQLLELQAEWENLAAYRQDSTARLLGVQRAFDLYHSRLVAYAGQNHDKVMPEQTLNREARIRAWCGMVRTILLRSGVTTFPTHMMAKIERVARRLASRLSVEPPTALGERNLAGAIGQLDLVIDWCVALEAKVSPVFEVGASSPA